jgi:hypothetical protein
MKDRAYIDKSTSHLNVHFYYVAQTMLLTCEKPCEKHVNNTDVNNTCEKLFVSFSPSPNPNAHARRLRMFGVGIFFLTHTLTLTSPTALESFDASMTRIGQTSRIHQTTMDSRTERKAAHRIVHKEPHQSMELLCPQHCAQSGRFGSPGGTTRM